MPIIAKGGSDKEYERVILKEWVEGMIEEVQCKIGVERYFTDSETKEKKSRIVDEVRFKFLLKGYEWPHYSRWMTLSTNERSTLYNKILRPLLGDNIVPGDIADVELLKNARVRTMWDEVKLKDGRMFQFVMAIDPIGEMPEIRLEHLECEGMVEEDEIVEEDKEIPNEPDEDVPF